MKDKRQPLRIRPTLAAQICWGLPESMPRELCGLCHGALSDVPFMLWKPDGSAASFCDRCTEMLFE